MGMKSNILTEGVSLAMHTLIVSVFALAFTLFYKPFNLQEILYTGNATVSFNATMIFCIILVSLILTRTALYFLGKLKRINKIIYALWCAGEIIIASMFISLYMSLMMDTPLTFFEIAGKTLGMMTFICIYPYSFLWLGMELYAKNNDNSDQPDNSSLVRFHDEYGKLRFVIAPEAVIYIKSEENYVQIYYADNGRVRKHTLRSSMRALEALLLKHGLIRCHRSYFINPEHVKMVHRDSSGLVVAHLKHDIVESIPISRKYQEEVSRIL